MSRRTVINLVFFVFVFLLMCVWAVQNIVRIDAIDKPYTISGRFDAASGVLPNAEVAYLGVHYGVVTKVDSVDGGVRMTLKIDRAKKDIPKEATARIFRKSAIGEPYIDFQSPDGFDPKTAQPSDYMRNGDTIRHTQNPLEFSELLRSASRLLHGIDADKAASLVHELAAALSGRSESLRQLTMANDELAATFAAKTDALDRLSTNNTKITHVLADHAGDLGQSLTNLSLLANSLKNANGNTAVLLDQGSEFMGEVANLVDAEKGNLDCVLHDLGDVIDMSSTLGRVAGTAYLLDNGRQAFDDVFASRDEGPDGVWVRVNLLENPANPSKQYSPPLELPLVPAVPDCASTIASVQHGPSFTATKSADIVPSQVLAETTTSRAPLARTGGIAFVFLAVVVLAAAAVFRWVAHHADDRR